MFRSDGCPVLLPSLIASILWKYFEIFYTRFECWMERSKGTNVEIIIFQMFGYIYQISTYCKIAWLDTQIQHTLYYNITIAFLYNNRTNAIGQWTQHTLHSQVSIQRTQHGIFHRSHVAMFSEGIKTLILCIITVFTSPLELFGTEPLQADSLLGHKP